MLDNGGQDHRQVLAPIVISVLLVSPGRQKFLTCAEQFHQISINYTVHSYTVVLYSVPLWIRAGSS